MLEARDRIGGRTWLAKRLGMDLELGGGWVHWVQPYVWAELGRYGLEVTPSPEPANAYWWSGSEGVSGTPETLLDLLDRPNQLLVAEARDVFAQPFAPLSAPRMNGLDGISLRKRIGGLPLSPEQRTMLESFWTLNFNGSIDDAAYTQALRWVALTNSDWRANFEACATYKVAGGTQALATAIASDGDAEIIFDTDVTALDTKTDGVRATCGGGRVFPRGSGDRDGAGARARPHPLCARAVLGAAGRDRAGASGAWGEDLVHARRRACALRGPRRR